MFRQPAMSRPPFSYRCWTTGCPFLSFCARTGSDTLLENRQKCTQAWQLQAWRKGRGCCIQAAASGCVDAQFFPEAGTQVLLSHMQLGAPHVLATGIAQPGTQPAAGVAAAGHATGFAHHRYAAQVLACTLTGYAALVIACALTECATQICSSGICMFTDWVCSSGTCMCSDRVCSSGICMYF